MPKNIITINQDSANWSRVKGLRPRLALAAMVTQKHLPKGLQFPISANLLDKATNVLSFPQHEPVNLKRFKAPKEPVEMGDIAIAYQYMVSESKKDHKILIDHVTHLFIHGLLHLFGYDHLNDPDATRMERLETKIMAALDLPDPYATADIMEPNRSRKTAKKRSAGLFPRK